MLLNIFKIILVLLIINFNLIFSIIYGDIPSYGQFPWHVYLQIRKGITGQFYCGGSLISSEWILTLGYCIFDATYVIARLGSIRREYSPVRLVSTRYIVHPNFTKSLESDMGLVKIKSLTNIIGIIEPIALAKRTMTEEYLVGKTTSICGFGRYSLTKKHAEKILRFQQVRIIPKKVCSYLLKDLPKHSFCARSVNTKQSTCFGDGGGGMILSENGKQYLVGVYSFQTSHCVGKPGGYQLVQEHLKWISHVTDIAT